MTTDIRLSATLRPTCEARTGFAPGDYGEVPLWCRQVVGVTSFIDAQGHTRHHCSMDGHKAAVVARYGEAPKEPYLVADPVEAAKRREWVQDFGGYVVTIDEAPE